MSTVTTTKGALNIPDVEKPVAVPKTNDAGDVQIRKENAKKLKAGYTRTKRFMECCYLSAFTYLWTTQIIATGRFLVHSPDTCRSHFVSIPVMILSAMVLADLISGIAHWGLDTWGTPDTIIFGNFIRSFREHHVDQMAMTKHDFIETNADTTLPLLVPLLLQRFFMMPNTINNVAANTFLLTLILLVALTNQFHKWAHEAKPSPTIRALMKYNIILNPQGHRRHHRGNFDQSYCITTGWLNPLLDAVDFWRRAETLVTSLTGEIPRANDAVMLGN